MWWRPRQVVVDRTRMDGRDDNISVKRYLIDRDGVQIGTTTATSYSDTGLSDLTDYTYSVYAVDAAGNVSDASPPSTATTPDGTPPSAPTGVVATAIGQNTVSIGWAASSDNVGVVGYVVQRNGTLAVGTTTSALTFTDLAWPQAPRFPIRCRQLTSREIVSAVCSGDGHDSRHDRADSSDRTPRDRGERYLGEPDLDCRDRQRWRGPVPRVSRRYSSRYVDCSELRRHGPDRKDLVHLHRVCARRGLEHLAGLGSLSLTTPPRATPRHRQRRPASPPRHRVQPDLVELGRRDRQCRSDCVSPQPWRRTAPQSTARTFVDSSLASATSFTYSVVAIDAAGNVSRGKTVTLATPLSAAPSGAGLGGFVLQQHNAERRRDRAARSDRQLLVGQWLRPWPASAPTTSARAGRAS